MDTKQHQRSSEIKDFIQRLVQFNRKRTPSSPLLLAFSRATAMAFEDLGAKIETQTMSVRGHSFRN